jgi:hypothetical protein
MPVQDIDRGWDALSNQLDQLRGDPHVLIGVQGAQAASSHGGDAVTNAQVASWNEFGTGRIPSRSFIRDTIDLNQQRLLAMALKLGGGILEAKLSAARALGLLGEHTRGLMLQRITDHIPPKNADSTIARKGSDTPLIAFTGALKNSITYRLG